MSGDINDRRIPYALNSKDELVSINSIKASGLRGLACNCRCPKCKEPLEARIGEGIRAPYFAHSKHSNCHGAMMTILHRRSIDLIEKYKMVMVPECYAFPPRKLEFIKVEVEKREDRNDMQPDVVGITDDGKRWAIEIRNTHEVGIEKRNKIIESGLACLEIDVRKQSVETLENFMFNQTDCRKWINNPYDDESLVKPKLISRVETPVPDYIYNPSKIRVQKKDNYRLKIPDSCRSLADYYTYLKSRKTFYIAGRRQNIVEVIFSPEYEQLFIFYNESSGISYYNITCVYADSDGNILEYTEKCSGDNIPTLLEAIKEDWKLKEKEQCNRVPGMV